MGTPAPAWVRSAGTLGYGGTYGFTNSVDPASGTTTFPMTGRVVFTGGGPTWQGYHAQTMIQYPGLDTPSVLDGVTGGTGLYWCDSTVLAGLASGQMLDTDPCTGQQVAVTGASQDRAVRP